MISVFGNKKLRTDDRITEEVFGKKMSFAAKEAYKLLRTNLMFALSSSEDDRGHIVGITSSLRGEGKSTTTVNLACVLAEQGKRVVVVEGDLRLPTLRKKLKIRSRDGMKIHVKEGLTNVLISRGNPLDYTLEYKVGMVDDKPISFDLLPVGEIPPNPSELLGSRRMEETLNKLAEIYDFVLLDLPPITAVADALIASKMVNGVVLVVRNGYSDTGSLNEAIRQMQQVNGKILGFVFTCANASMGGYRRKYKYRYYNYNYH